MFPEGILTRAIEVGPASDLSTGDPLAIRVMVEYSRQLVWGGEPVPTSLRTYNFAPGAVGQIELPVTDQDGYRDSKNNIIELGNGEHAFYYKLSTFYLRNGSVFRTLPVTKVLLPEGSGPVDIDEMATYQSGTSAGTISVPDSWSSQIAIAQAAATAAANSAIEVAESIENLEAFVEDSVDSWFETNAGTVISPAVLAAAIQEHRDEPTPHKAYDIDMPSLTVLFENGLV